jgi:hypothetical protein
MRREMYPSTPFVEDNTRQVVKAVVSAPPIDRTQSMLLRAYQGMNREAVMPTKSLYLRHPNSALPGSYLVKKFDKDFEPLDTYTLTRAKSTGEWTCTCPARTTECRHIRMLPIFDRAERGEDPLFTEVSDNGRYQVFLSYDGKMYDWVRGPELPLED